jgi:hypothetical protein
MIEVEAPDDLAAQNIVSGSPGEITGRWREFRVPADELNTCPATLR